jgi:hypothetical protein
MNASPNRALMACWARHPVQWAGDDDAGHQRAKVVEDPGDERLEDRSVEVEPTHHGVERAFVGQPPGVAANVDDPGVAAAGDHQ